MKTFIKVDDAKHFRAFELGRKLFEVGEGVDVEDRLLVELPVVPDRPLGAVRLGDQMKGL